MKKTYFPYLFLILALAGCTAPNNASKEGVLEAGFRYFSVNNYTAPGS